MTEQDFLKKYDVTEFKQMSVAVDVVIFRMKKDLSCLQVLLKKRNQHPDMNKLSLIGTFLGYDESAEETVYRILRDRYNINRAYLEQLYTMTEPERDLRTRVISIAYIAILPYSKDISDNEACWYDIKVENNTITLSSTEEDESVSFSFYTFDEKFELNVTNDTFATSASKFHIAFDHASILVKAISRVKGKILYTNIGFSFMDNEFTLPDLQRVYEIVLDRKFTSKTQFKTSLLGRIKEQKKKGKSVVGNKLSMLYKYI